MIGRPFLKLRIKVSNLLMFSSKINRDEEIWKEAPFARKFEKN